MTRLEHDELFVLVGEHGIALDCQNKKLNKKKGKERK